MKMTLQTRNDGCIVAPHSPNAERTLDADPVLRLQTPKCTTLLAGVAVPVNSGAYGSTWTFVGLTLRYARGLAAC